MKNNFETAHILKHEPIQFQKWKKKLRIENRYGRIVKLLK